MAQEFMWHTKDGGVIPLSYLRDNHLLNIYRQLKRRIFDREKEQVWEQVLALDTDWLGDCDEYDHELEALYRTLDVIEGEIDRRDLKKGD